jgi:hypothetical protein
MPTYEYAKRKSTAADHIEAEHSKRARMTEDYSIAEDREPQSASNNAQAVLAANPIPARPWLARQQNISEQDLWVIYCRDNLVPGAIGPKNWGTVGAEFNEHFEEKLKQPFVLQDPTTTPACIEEAFLCR